MNRTKPAAARSGHAEYTPGCDWCEATEDALEILSRREVGPGQVTGPPLRRVRAMILSVTQTCGNPAIPRRQAGARVAALVVLVLAALVALAPPATAEEGPWRLIPASGGQEGYANFAWRINTETGQVHGLRFQHSEENGWTIDLVDLTCADGARDMVERGDLQVEKLESYLELCRELERGEP